MIVLVILVVLCIIYYFINPSKKRVYLGLNGSCVKILNYTLSTIVVSYIIDQDFSNPISLSRFHFKTTYLRWRKL